MIGTSLGLFLALVRFEGWLFNYLDNWMRLNCIGEGMQKGREDKGDHMATFDLQTIGLDWPHSTFVGFVGVKDDTFPRVFHEFAEEDEGKKLALIGFKSPPPIDT